MLQIRRIVKGKTVVISVQSVDLEEGGRGGIVTVSDSSAPPGAWTLVSPVLPMELSGRILNWVVDLATWQPLPASPAPEIETAVKHAEVDGAMLRWAEHTLVGEGADHDEVEQRLRDEVDAAVLEWAMACGWRVVQ